MRGTRIRDSVIVADAESAGRMWISASGPGPACVVLRWFGRRVGSLGPA